MHKLNELDKTVIEKLVHSHIRDQSVHHPVKAIDLTLCDELKVLTDMLKSALRLRSCQPALTEILDFESPFH